MNIKKLIKQLFDVYKKNQRIWKGIYQHYSDVPIASKNYYDRDESVNATLKRTKNSLINLKQHKIIPTKVTSEHALLALITSLLCERGKVRILDFGGGMGETYIHLINSLAKSPGIDYHIVETKKMCEMGESLFKNDSKIHYHTSLPNLSKVDIVYMCSVLQYIEDYANLLKTLCGYSSKYILFTKLSAGNIPTYASIQKKGVKGFPTPYWFINVSEIIRIMHKMGYELIFKGVLEREYNQDNFPTKYRMGRACNLLFSQINSLDSKEVSL